MDASNLPLPEQEQPNGQPEGSPKEPPEELPKESKAPKDSASGKILSTGMLLVVTLMSLLVGLAHVVRSLRNVKLTLRLQLKRDDRAEKKY